MAANSQQEKESWMIALKEHRRQILETRMKVFEQKLGIKA
jgi:hypothetical protein